MAARIEVRRDLRGNCEGAQKSDFSRQKNVFFPMAGMDRSTLISQIKKRNNSVDEFPRPVGIFESRCVPGHGGGVPRRDCRKDEFDYPPPRKQGPPGALFLVAKW